MGWNHLNIVDGIYKSDIGFTHVIWLNASTKRSSEALSSYDRSKN